MIFRGRHRRITLFATPYRLFANSNGQILLEALITVAVVAILASSIVTLIVVTNRNLESARRRDIASSLSTEAFTALRSIVESDDATSQGYNRIYCPPSGTCPSTKGTATHYYAVLTNGIWGVASGDETLTLQGISFTRYLTIENVCRNGTVISGPTDTNGSTTTCTGSGGTHDPSTLRLTSTLQAKQMTDLVVSQYVTRWRNVVSDQTDWSGGQ